MQLEASAVHKQPGYISEESHAFEMHGSPTFYYTCNLKNPYNKLSFSVRNQKKNNMYF